jgi:cobalt-zinc-cadmium efflux system outer membrane protein
LELRQSQARSQADIRLQLAQGRIDYTTGVEYRRQQGINGMGNSLGVFVSAPLPVFNRNQGEILRAQRENQQAEVARKAGETRVLSEVVAAWDQYATSRKLLEDVESRMLTRAKSVLEITEYSYRRGEATLIEYLDAQKAFSEVTQSYNEARTNYALSLYLIDSVAAASLAQP